MSHEYRRLGRCFTAAPFEYSTLLIGAGFPGDKPLDDELRTHGVALLEVDDLIALLRADASHPIAWTELAPLLSAGRASERVSDLIFKHEHGARQRASIVLRFMLEEGARRSPSQLRRSSARSIKQAKR